MIKTSLRAAVLLVTSAIAVACGSSEPATATAGTGGAGGHATATTTGNGGSFTSSSSSGAIAAGGGGGAPSGKVIYFDDFDAPGATPDALGYFAQAGGAVSLSTDASKNYGGSAGSIQGIYPTPGSGGVYVYSTKYDLSAQNTRNVYVRFRAKMPGAKQGLKFLKIFGAQGADGGYANTTFGLDYTGADPGGLIYVGFGDGSALQNDTANGVWLAGINDADAQYHGVGRSKPTATVLTPQNASWPSSAWGASWHLFECAVGFNSGTSAQDEVADGFIKLKIDGVPYVDATGLFNRYWSNGPIDRIELFGWSQSGSQPFEVWYDDVEVAVDGWGNSPV